LRFHTFTSNHLSMSIFSSIKNKLFGPPIDYKELIKNGAVIVDVRSPQEFKSGHAKKSKNIPLNVLKSKTSTLKGKEVLLVCKSGGRAGMAKSILKKEGILAYNLGPWQKAQHL
jgi:phage shock protein E